jgi:hypothetical protein
MLRILTGCLALTLALACSPVLAARTPASLRTDAPADFLPEGLAWDAIHRRFLLGSIRLHRVDAIDPRNGHTTRFTDAPGSVLGMQIGTDGQTLWAAWTRFAGHYKHNRGTGIAAWSLRDGHALGVWPIPDHDPGANLGDLLVVDQHTIVTSDSGTGAIYRFDMRTHRYRVLVAAGQLVSPQGITRARQPGFVVLADYPTGLWLLHLDDGQRQLMAAPASGNLRGLDGLYRAGDAVIAVQNGTATPHILRIELDEHDAITRVDTLAEGRPSWDQISLGAMVDHRFWFNAVSQWGNYDDELRPLRGKTLRPPLLDSVDTIRRPSSD